MLEINIAFAPYISYGNEFVQLAGRRYEIPVTLVDGTHTFRSDSFVVGSLASFENRQLMAHITFQYSYDEAAHVITVNGTDFASADSITLVTFPEGTSEFCRQRAVAPAGFPADDLTANPHWNYRTPLMPGLEDVLRGMAREANDSLIAALETVVDGLIVQVRKDPPTLSADDYQQLLAVYRDGTFHGFYGQIDDYGPGDVVQTIESTFGGTVQFNAGENFANVIGSSNDPKISGKTWVNLWADQFGVYPNICTSFKYLGFGCGSTIYGGHIVTGQVAKAMPAGSNAVYILPICVQHNNDDNVYMAALQYQAGIWLKNYLG
jgi:hypothetical protein